MDDKSINFLYHSINDIQGVIRAIDLKLSFILIILAIPLPKVYAINAQFAVLISNFDSILIYLLIVSFILLWFFASILALMGLSSINNSSKYIDPIAVGSFYASHFNFTFLDAILNLNDTKSSHNIDEIIKLLPKNTMDIQRELVFEQLKLGYIRDIKIIRQHYAYYALIAWLSSGIIIGFLSVF